MFGRQYKFIKDTDSIMIYDCDKEFVGSIPQTFDELTIEEKKILKQRMLIPKILIIIFSNTLTFIFFPVFALKYKNYVGVILYILFIALAVGLLIIEPDFINPLVDRSILYEQYGLYLIMGGLVMFIAELWFIIRGAKTAYNNKSYPLLELIYESRKINLDEH